MSKQKERKKYIDGEAAAVRILSVLSDMDIPNTPSGDSVAITCPYHPTHSGLYPDPIYHRLSINLVPKWKDGKYIPVGVFHCWSCGANGHFNQLIDDDRIPQKKRLKAEGLPLAGSYDDDQLLPASLNSVQEAPYEPPNPIELEPWKGDWRGIREDVLLALGAETLFDYVPNSKSVLDGVAVGYAVRRLLFRCYNYDDCEIGWIALAPEKYRRENPKGLKQKNSKGSWAKKTFLFVEAMTDPTYVVLVEGPYDALRLIQCGIQSVAMLGAGNWSEDKRNLLVSRYDNVIVLFDGDETGYVDSDIVEKDLGEYVNVLNMRLPIYDKLEDQIDPANMPYKYVVKLKKKINAFVGDTVFKGDEIENDKDCLLLRQLRGRNKR